VVRSPAADITQLAHDTPDRQAQAGVVPHAAGSGLHVYVPATPVMAEARRSQNCAPFMQNRGPHANVPAGAMQPPASEMSWPAAEAAHGFEYTVPSQPHTLSSSVVHPCGRAPQVPIGSSPAHVLPAQSQNCVAEHVMAPHGTPVGPPVPPLAPPPPSALPPPPPEQPAIRSTAASVAIRFSTPLQHHFTTPHTSRSPPPPSGLGESL
jgi:hypothetical protein